MRPPRLLVPAILAALAASASVSAMAEVLRCEDVAGKVSYTDGSCPAGSKPQRVSTQEPVSVLPDPQGDRARAAQRETTRQPYTASAQQQPAHPAGAVIIDGRGATPEQRSDSQRWDGELGADPQMAQDGYYPYPYPYAGGGRRPGAPLPRPLPRKCDPATGCTDRMGNNFNQNTGKLQRYQSIDGKTCNPVGTTVVCR